MRILSLLILNLLMVFQDRPSVPPHGADFKISCGICHSSKGWYLDKEIYSFNHNATAYPLVGEHTQANCRQCHPTLIFKDARTDCNDCHSDVHQGTVGLECSGCHTPKSWLVSNINEIHRLSRFPLEGAHRTADCSDCHTSESLIRFEVTGVNCVDCHRQDYITTAEPNHVQAGIPEDCILCHQVNSFQWTEADFNHLMFPLDQGHSTVKCEECHNKGSYSGTARECYQCHQVDFLDSKSPDHSSSMLPTNCENCHTLAKGWKPTLYDHSSFPLTFGHSDPTCIECHIGGSYSNTSPDCFSCHRPDYTDSKNPDHTAAGFSNVCMTCHSTNPGWAPTTYVHGGFPLEQAHSIPDCIECHIGDNYTTLASDCYSCHNKEYTAAENPNHSVAGFPRDCETCHSTSPDWKPANFDHNIFPLTLGHSTPVCIECHTDGNYNLVPKECNSCHLENYLSSENPKHTAAGFSQDCLTCHSTNPGWTPTNFEHNFFPLVSGHSTSTCVDCHIGETYASTVTDCYSCHQQEYTATTNPNHTEALFPKECQTCHTTNPGWKPTSFTHSMFPLTLGHSTSDCIDCHIAGDYSSTSPECYACHQADFLATANPNHTSAAFSQLCQTCHSTNPGWEPTTFGHNSFPLTLGHSAPSCIECHIGEIYEGILSECYSCHRPDYDASSDPKHTAAGFSTICNSCHNANPGWIPTAFTHGIFPLTGGHSIARCNDCHIGDNYTTMSTDCYNCHQPDFVATTNPNHSDAMFPQTCETCHSTNPGWTPTTFTHGGFPLTLGHSTASCNDCHIAGNYTSTPSDCYSCHQQNYLNTTDPDHSAAAFVTVCETCHTTSPGWQPTSFNHTYFPLTLGHSGPTCIECHVGENYTTITSDCYVCHQTDFNSATDPNHVTAAFPQVCQTCHSTNPGWQPTIYDHSSFPLTLGHSTLFCADCHIGGNYTSTPTDCYSCHQNNFNTSIDPNHLAASFSNVCQTCHTTNPGWQPASFLQHDVLYFPVYSGTHQGEWSSCSECHTNSSDYKIFSCILCHEHSNATETNSHHNNVSLYTYSATSCYDCHRNGRGK